MIIWGCCDHIDRDDFHSHLTKLGSLHHYHPLFLIDWFIDDLILFSAGHEDDPLQLVEGVMEEVICMPGTTTMNTKTEIRWKTLGPQCYNIIFSKYFDLIFYFYFLTERISQVIWWWNWTWRKLTHSPWLCLVLMVWAAVTMTSARSSLTWGPVYVTTFLRDSPVDVLYCRWTEHSLQTFEDN